MAPPSRLWRAVAGIFVAVNVGGFIFALLRGERMHAESHVIILLLGIGFYRLWLSRRGFDTPSSDDQVAATQRLDHLEESLDVIAVEVERIGESQRYARKILEQRIATLAKRDE
jgi:hypothetical protein